MVHRNHHLLRMKRRLDALFGAVDTDFGPMEAAGRLARHS